MTYAVQQRGEAAGQARAAEVIEITEDWYEKLSSVPFISCKYPTTPPAPARPRPWPTWQIAHVLSPNALYSRIKRNVQLGGPPARPKSNRPSDRYTSRRPVGWPLVGLATLLSHLALVGRLAQRHPGLGR